jgi:Putative zinc- or iron-chelating domain
VRPTSSLRFQDRLTLGWGKMRRFYLAHFRPGYVRRSLARRVGHCNRTGACCHLMFTCPLLDRRTEPVRCSIHEIKPKVCHLFPIDERDLRDRDLVSPDVPCGFSFIPVETARAAAAEDSCNEM